MDSSCMHQFNNIHVVFHSFRSDWAICCPLSSGLARVSARVSKEGGGVLECSHQVSIMLRPQLEGSHELCAACAMQMRVCVSKPSSFPRGCHKSDTGWSFSTSLCKSANVRFVLLAFPFPSSRSGGSASAFCPASSSSSVIF